MTSIILTSRPSWITNFDFILIKYVGKFSIFYHNRNTKTLSFRSVLKTLKEQTDRNNNKLWSMEQKNLPTGNPTVAQVEEFTRSACNPTVRVICARFF